MGIAEPALHQIWTHMDSGRQVKIVHMGDDVLVLKITAIPRKDWHGWRGQVYSVPRRKFDRQYRFLRASKGRDAQVDR